MMKCEIIRDLIPLYLDKVCSEDSRKLVEEHLACLLYTSPSPRDTR